MESPVGDDEDSHLEFYEDENAVSLDETVNTGLSDSTRRFYQV